MQFLRALQGFLWSLDSSVQWTTIHSSVFSNVSGDRILNIGHLDPIAHWVEAGV
jgi:hypothetical protein